jgi:MSHA pilin protein MshD
MRREYGTTLIELVVSVMIIATVATAAMMLVAQTTGRSADPLIRIQAIAIAEAYMAEILAQPLTDPAGGDTGSSEAGETRAVFDDLTDYAGLSDHGGAVDQNGAPIDGLDGYNIDVSVTDAMLNGAAARRIEVVVGHDADPSVTFPLVAYRVL